MLDFIEHNPGADFCVVLCHGFGANMHDLAVLADTLSLPAPVRWVFPQAPAEFPGYPSARAWFPQTAAEIEAFATGDSFDKLSGIDPPGLRSSAEQLLELLSELNVNVTRTLIGGFSQGAMVAVEAAISIPSNAAAGALAILSGSLIAEARWGSFAHRLQSVPVFQSHGTADPILPFNDALRLHRLLDEAGAAVRFVRFAGGHAVPGPVASAFAEFLTSLLRNAATGTPDRPTRPG